MSKKIFKMPEQSKHGEISMRKELADGVYLIATNAAIRVLMVAQSLADKMLSKSASVRGEQDGNHLSFTELDGKSAIPMLELAQKGYIRQTNQEIKSHFRNIVKLFPDYLKERGIFQRAEDTLQSKIEKEFKLFGKELVKLPKEDIIALSSEIATRMRIKDYFHSASLSQEGLLLAQDNLLEMTHEKIKGQNKPFTDENIAEAIKEVQKQIAPENKEIQKRIQGFEKELQLAKQPEVKSVVLYLETSHEKVRFVMNMKDFVDCLEPEMMDRFAKVSSPDFPDSSYYGAEHEALFTELQNKRFFADFMANFNAYASQGANGTRLTVEQVSEQPIKENEFEGILNRFRLKEYITANYNNPDESLSGIKEYFSDQAELISDIQEIVNENATEEVEMATEEIDEEQEMG